MIFDLQLFDSTKPASGVALAQNETYEIEFGATAGTGDTWKAGTDYNFGLKKNGGKVSGVAVFSEETESTTSFSYIDLNGNNQYDASTDASLVSDQWMDANGSTYIFNTNGSLMVENAAGTGYSFVGQGPIALSVGQASAALTTGAVLTNTSTVTEESEFTNVSVLGVLSSTQTWNAGGIAKIEKLALEDDALYADGAAWTLNINNGYMEEIDLNGKQMNLKLTSVGKYGNKEQTVKVSNIDTGDGLNRTITFNGGSKVNMVTEDEVIDNGRAYIKNGKYTADLIVGTNLQNVTVSGTKNGSMEFKTADVRGTVLNFGEGSDSVFINANSMAGDSTLVTRAEGTELVTVNNFGDTTPLTDENTLPHLHITGLKDSSNYIINGKSNGWGGISVNDFNGQNAGVDTKSSVSIIGAESGVNSIAAGWDWRGGLVADLSGKGIEYVSIANHGASVIVDDGDNSYWDGTTETTRDNDADSGWVFTTRSIIGAKGANVVSIGDHSILDVEGAILGNKTNGAEADISALAGATRSNVAASNANQYMYLGTHMDGSGDADKTGEAGDPSRIVITSAATNRTAEEINNNAMRFGSYEGMLVESKGTTYKALMMSSDALDSVDGGLNWSAYDIVVGDVLNLGTRTDKKVVYLNNGLDENNWGETISYSANMTSVISSSAGASLVVGDFENKINFRANGNLDSLYGGRSYGVGGYDTLSSVGGKKAWMGTGIDSGLTKVELLHNGSQTYNFGFVGEDYSVTGGTVTGTETAETADVLALMNGMGYRSLDGSEHKRVNLSAGSDASNHFMFQSISEGVHDIMYTWDLGAKNQIARVDTSLGGSTSNFNYSDDVSFYLGFGDTGAPEGRDPVLNVSERVHKTVLTMNAEDTGKMVNYGGGNVVLGLTTIDGSAAKGGNILNGQQDYAEYIIASETNGDTLCGGITGTDTDKASDTLVGGEGADVFWVGAEMGDDVIANLTDGDTIVFLGSKFADATLNYENERMEDYADSHWMTISFDEEAGGATIRVTPGNGITDHLHDVKNVTAVFDDGTYTWDGSSWTKA